MLKNYIIISLRNLVKQKYYFFVNLAGLSLGIATFLFILIYVASELNYDRYPESAGQIYRIGLNARVGGNDIRTPMVGAPVAEALKNDYPEVLDAVRIRKEGDFVVRNGEVTIKEERVAFVDANFFGFFSVPLLQGDPRTAVAAPNSVVLTETTARKYFGEADPIGKILELGNLLTYKVTGVCADIPTNSHFHFDMFASLISLDRSRERYWTQSNFYTYLMFPEEYDGAQFEAKFPSIINKYMAPEIQQVTGMSLEKFRQGGGAISLFLQPLTDIHLHSALQDEFEPNGDIKYVYIFGALALLVIVIACVNYVNLSTASSIQRAKEIAIRKALGSYRSLIITQFLVQSMVLTGIAIVLALILVLVLTPVFNDLVGKELSLFVINKAVLVGSLLFVILFVGLLAGSYPAFFLSNVEPARALKGKFQLGNSGNWLRNILVVMQFAISTSLIIGTSVIYLQFNYIKNKKLGFNKEQVLVLNETHDLGSKVQAFKQELLKNRAIQQVAVSGFMPVTSSLSQTNTFVLTGGASRKELVMQHWYVDYDYIDALSMHMKTGRAFSQDFATDSSAVILNQRAVKLLGLENPVGKQLSRTLINPVGNERTLYTVIGVVDDFHYASMRQEIGPLALSLGESNGNFLVKATSANMQTVLDDVKRIWNRYSNTPLNYSFLDDLFEQSYHDERIAGRVFGLFAGIAILLACLGLFSLSAFVTQQKVKEIGIRKVLGASSGDIVIMYSKAFLKLVAVAILIALPISYYFMNQWLLDFYYRMRFGFDILLFASVATLMVALFTVTYHSVKAALSNPIKSLQSDG